MSFLIINGLGVEFAEMERSVVNTVMVQSATTTSAAASLVAYSSLHQTPLKFEILQGSLLVGGVTGGAIAATQVRVFINFLLNYFGLSFVHRFPRGRVWVSASCWGRSRWPAPCTRSRC